MMNKLKSIIRTINDNLPIPDSPLYTYCYKNTIVSKNEIIISGEEDGLSLIIRKSNGEWKPVGTCIYLDMLQLYFPYASSVTNEDGTLRETTLLSTNRITGHNDRYAALLQARYRTTILAGVDCTVIHTSTRRYFLVPDSRYILIREKIHENNRYYVISQDNTRESIVCNDYGRFTKIHTEYNVITQDGADNIWNLHSHLWNNT